MREFEGMRLPDCLPFASLALPSLAPRSHTMSAFDLTPSELERVSNDHVYTDPDSLPLLNFRPESYNGLTNPVPSSDGMGWCYVHLEALRVVILNSLSVERVVPEKYLPALDDEGERAPLFPLSLNAVC
jgi:hypothetical protein